MTAVIAAARDALAEPAPDPGALETTAGRFDGWGGAIVAWLGSKGDLAVDEFIKSSIKAVTWTKVATAFFATAEILHQLAVFLSASH